ncbi:MAG: tRNA (adenosine(37)-N6)-dimethylallyltransferase MiaA [Gammaproteobacteria bacterium]|nr:tRNA (adenosine(37)-N6)-dimethylallyltransferase MiaA [Gammaproteobacteria bacterium]NND55279.1 tRNA (adenosine(37)-N6)-dimethylallyltransferase MiaA [Gammaproteobacteria bacterium]
MTATAELRAVCIMGPTAAGKTAVALRLAEQFPVEIISVDSALVYRGMDIGTAKPTPAERARVPHRLIDIREPHEAYSAGAFCRDAAMAMREISAAGRVPVLVGGTMLYFQALQQGLADMPEADPALRADIDARAARQGWPAMHAELAELDATTAARLEPTDAQRIQRALEVCLLAGEPLSQLQEETAPLIEANYLNIGLLPSDRAQLHRRIAARLDHMFDTGFVAEVAALLQRPELSPDSAALRAVGYRQVLPHLAGECALEEARDKALVATRRLAKRQLTWLRGWPELQVVDCLDSDCGEQVGELVANWLAAHPR